MAAGSRHTFVLVHGAWHGAWCWRRLADRLLAAGHRVFTPTLTGLAERSHLLRADITLDTHVLDVANVFQWEDIEGACLVGHSYAGWVISGAVERLRSRVRSLVYVDAFLPDNGQCGLDLMPPEARTGYDAARARGDIGRAPPPAAWFRIMDPQDEAWVDRKMTAQPLGVSDQPIVLTDAREVIARKCYIRTPAFANAAFDAALKRCEQTAGWRTHSLDGCGHDVMIDAPDRLAALLVEAAG